jgi:hypothetical protein
MIKHKQVLLNYLIEKINPLIALLEGPDIQYKNILTQDNEQLNVPVIHNQCQDKNLFLQIHVRKLAKKSKRPTKNSVILIY